ncbi:MAG TPA: hypothetical protein VF618_13295 [Thermoanaerobaculia bacterium]
MTTIITLDEVLWIRESLVRAHQLANARFVAGVNLPATAYLELLAAAMFETAQGVHLPANERVTYEISGTTIAAKVPRVVLERTPAAVFEYWLIMSELHGSSSWRMTRVIATAEEYDTALREMQEPQLVRALVASFLPAAEWREDGTAYLEVTLYTRAQEERIERRHLMLDQSQELHFHSRELIAEGRGGIA